MSEKKIRIGKIIKTHGLKGEFKIYPYTSDIDSYKNYKDIYVEGKEQKYTLAYAKIMNNVLIGKFKEINNIDDVTPILNKSIFIDYSDKRKMEKDEYLISELIGLEVYEGENKIGEIADIYQYAANDVIKVATKDGEKLIPNVKQFVKSIDMENKKMTVELIEGM